MTISTATPTEHDGVGVGRLSGHIGAEIHVGLDRLLGDRDTQRLVRAALHEHLVLVFRRLAPTAHEHVALAEVFGGLQPVESYNVAHPESDAITVFDSAQGYRADEWHSDASWREAVPMGAALCARRCPDVGLRVQGKAPGRQGGGPAAQRGLRRGGQRSPGR